MQKTISKISLDCIFNNTKTVKGLIGERKLYAVVKADAYGHGAEAVSLEIQPSVDGFCVAIVEEGVALRVCGVVKPILVLCPPLDAYDVERCAFYSLTPTVNGVGTAKLIGDLPCHIKVNTGMNRYGLAVCELKDTLSVLSRQQIQGVYSHLYMPSNVDAAQRQLEIFDIAEEIVKKYNPSAFAHLSSSAGIFLGDKYLKDGVRCGILLYGYSPFGRKINGIEPALKVYARKVQTSIVVGNGAGYYVADKEYKRLSTFRFGYADGFARKGRWIGNLCMDACISQDTGELKVVLDDAETVAEQEGTIAYETLCKATMRSEKIYER